MTTVPKTKAYPAIGRKRPPRGPGGLPCIVCGALTTGKVDIETSWFRGEDDLVRVCGPDQKYNEAILTAYKEQQ